MVNMALRYDVAIFPFERKVWALINNILCLKDSYIYDSFIGQ